MSVVEVHFAIKGDNRASSFREASAVLSALAEEASRQELEQPCDSTESSEPIGT